MKNIAVCLLLSCLLSCKEDKKHRTGEVTKSKPVSDSESRISDSLFRYHFRLLDSVAKTPLKDTMYNCCYNAVNFMEANTGIDADVEGDYGGATGFKKEDLQKWHQWYDSVNSLKR